ncbi:MAG: Gfo/Idh/MocA family oxidoreductase [Elusimicrobiota bacterium]
MAKLKAAVIGTGIFGENHVDAYASDPRISGVLVCDLDAKRAKAVAKKYGCEYTTSSKDVAADPDIKIVSIVTPDFAHRDLAIQMANAGKNVLIEKPLATSVKDAKDIILAVKKNGVKMMVDFHNRWNTPVYNARRQVDHGDLGRPVMAYAKLSDRIEVATKWFKWSAKSGPHWFLFPHLADLVCWLMKDKVVSVYASGVKNVLKSKGIDTYDAVQAIIKFEHSFATIESSWILPPAWPNLCEFAVSLHGTKGRVEIDLSDQCYRVADSKSYSRPFIIGKESIHGETVGFVPLPIKHFITCVIENKTPVVSPEDALLNVKILEAIVKSLSTGKVVKV